MDRLLASPGVRPPQRRTEPVVAVHHAGGHYGGTFSSAARNGPGTRGSGPARLRGLLSWARQTLRSLVPEANIRVSATPALKTKTCNLVLF